MKATIAIDADKTTQRISWLAFSSYSTVSSKPSAMSF